VTSSSLILFSVGAATGVTTVLFGFGGGFVTVPAVYLVASRDHADAMHVAVATSAAVMIVNATVATIGSARRGQLQTRFLWPVTVFIGIGSVVGAYAATQTAESLLHWLFVGYLAVTMIDCLLRRGFVSRAVGEVRPLTAVQSTAGGVVVGVVAGFLGVGGSVMTVPVLRRRGFGMAGATALANPLSLPVAIGATAVFSLANPSRPGSFGDVNLAATMALLAGSLLTIAATRFVLAGRRVPDSVHAAMYLTLLGVVLAGMVCLR
jgi:uncharacterized protein